MPFLVQTLRRRHAYSVTVPRDPRGNLLGQSGQWSYTMMDADVCLSFETHQILAFNLYLSVGTFHVASGYQP